MKNKISRIDIVSFQNGLRRVTIWRRQPCGIDSPTNYIAATKENSVTESSVIRAQRAQLALAGMEVDGWPWPEYCDCNETRDRITYDENGTKRCGNCMKALR